MTGSYTVNGKTISLTQSDWLASGGQGSVFKKSGTAYKLYTNPSDMIPVGKIQELSALDNLDNVLGPKDTIYKGNSVVGFTMKFVKDTEFLCRLFTRGFRDKNGVSQTTINGLVKRIQETAHGIHKAGILIVDANPFNFLVSGKFDEVFFIDVDSYKTKSYPANALMESVRDRKVKNNQFTELSDWFSVGCVMFELYIGCHPYKGRHPDFAPKDWSIMMDRGISVFNKKCKLPPSCYDLSVIPSGHLRWFEAVFERGDRLPPPAPDQMAPTGPIKAQIIQSNDKFNISLLYKLNGRIIYANFVDGICYAMTNDSVFANGREVANITPAGKANDIVRALIPTQGDLPIVAELNRTTEKLRCYTLKGKDIIEVESNGFFISNSCLYTVIGDSLVEISFVNTGAKTNAMQSIIGNVFHSHRVCAGMIVQNILGTCRLAIPYESGRCAIIRAKELDGVRIVDAVYDSGIAIFLCERGGNYERVTLVFAKSAWQNSTAPYSIRVEKNVNLHDIQLVIKDNGVCVSMSEDNFEVFLDNSKVKLIPSPLNGNERLFGFKNDIFVANGDSIHQISSK